MQSSTYDNLKGCTYAKSFCRVIVHEVNGNHKHRGQCYRPSSRLGPNWIRVSFIVRDWFVVDERMQQYCLQPGKESLVYTVP